MSDKPAKDTLPQSIPNGDLLRTFQQSYSELRRFLQRVTGSRERAEDLTHDVYLRLSTAETGATVRDGRAYVFRVAANLAADYGRRQQRRGLHQPMDDVADLLADPVPNAERVELARERLRLVDAALMELPNAVRQALLLNRVEGLGHAEIARRLGLSESTIAKHITRALLHCRKRTERPLFSMPGGRRETS